MAASRVTLFQAVLYTLLLMVSQYNWKIDIPLGTMDRDSVRYGRAFAVRVDDGQCISTRREANRDDEGDPSSRNPCHLAYRRVAKFDNRGG